MLERAERIPGQQPGDTNKLCAFHTPEVGCIGRGKARTRYEFGCKTSIATTNERCKGGQFVLAAISLPGNPHDGHGLAGQIDQVARRPEHPSHAPMLIAATTATRLSATVSTSPTPAASPRPLSSAKCEGAVAPLSECRHSPAGQ